MAHNKVYGICENKCQVEISPKNEQFELVQTLTVHGSDTITLYRYKNMMLASISVKGLTSGTSPALSTAYSTDLPSCLADSRVYCGSNYAEVSGRLIKLYGSGNFICNLIFLVNDDPYSITCDVNQSAITLGEKCIFRVEPSKDSDEYLYKFVARNTATGNESDLCDYSAATTFIYTFAEAGSFEVYASARRIDGGQLFKSESVPVTIYPVLKLTIKINDDVGPLTIKNGDTCEIVASATGGSGTYQYLYVEKDTTTGTITTLKAYSTSASCSAKLSRGGKKVIIVYVKDTTNTVMMSNSVSIAVYGWDKHNNIWTYYESTGDMVTGWKTISGKSYYFDPTTGEMWTSRWVSGKYWVKSDGSMAKSEWVDGGRYWVDENGVWDKTKTPESSDEPVDDTGALS